MFTSPFEPLESRQLFATNGLSTTYFDDPNFGGRTFTRVESNVNLDRGTAKPAPGIRAGTYSVRWSGLVRARGTEAVTFTLDHTDGARLWVGGSQLVDDWTAGAARRDSRTIKLRTGHWYDLRVEYFAGSNPGEASLTWRSPSFSNRAIDPARLLSYDQRFAAIGDFGRTTPYAQGTANTVNSWNPDFVVATGDDNYTSAGYDENVGKFYHQYIGNYRGKYGAGSSTNRFISALGNHDWDSIKAYQAFFTFPGNERYFDVAFGDIRFFVIDSDKREPDGTSPDSVQGQWLKNALARSTSPYNMVVFHHAPYSSAKHANVGYMRWPFKDWGADAVIAGHDHDYERLIEGGLLYFVDGAGAGPRSAGSPIKGSQFLDNTDSGALLIESNDRFMTFQYQLRSGKVIDTYTVART